MRIMPKAKCQRVLVLALWLVRFVVDSLYNKLDNKSNNQMVYGKSTTSAHQVHNMKKNPTTICITNPQQIEQVESGLN